VKIEIVSISLVHGDMQQKKHLSSHHIIEHHVYIRTTIIAMFFDS